MHPCRTSSNCLESTSFLPKDGFLETDHHEEWLLQVVRRKIGTRELPAIVQRLQLHEAAICQIGARSGVSVCSNSARFGRDKKHGEGGGNGKGVGIHE